VETTFSSRRRAPPSCVGLLVKDALVEIDLVGYVPRSRVEHQVIKSTAPRPLAHYSEAFTLGSHVFAGTDRQRLLTGVGDRAQARELSVLWIGYRAANGVCPENLKNLRRRGPPLDRVIRRRSFSPTSTISTASICLEALFCQRRPRTTIGCTGLFGQGHRSKSISSGQ
jgi:hypothetical protein